MFLLIQRILIMDVFYQIVDGLSKEEIRFFKIFAHRQGSEIERKDIALLDFIRKNPTKNDENKIVQKLYGNGDKNAFYRLKNRLIDDLNKSLVLQHNNDDEVLQLFQLLSLVRIYSAKSQHQIAVSFLKKAEQKAKRIEHHELLDSIYGEYILLSHTLLSIDPETYIALRKENSVALARIRQLDDVLAVVSYRLKVTQNFGSQEFSFLQILENVTKQFADEKVVLASPRFRIKLYGLVSQLLLQRHDYLSLEVYLLQIWNEFLNDHIFNKNNHDTKLQLLTYIVNTLFKNGKVQESLAFAEKLFESMQEYNRLFFEKYEIFYYNALVNNYSTSDIPKAIELLKEMQLKPNVKKMPFYELFIYLNLATSYFDLKKYSLSIKNLTKLFLLDSYKKADKSLRFKIALSELIIRFELGDTDFWKYRYDQILKEFLAEFTLQSSSREATMFHLVNRSLELHGGLRDKSIRPEIDQLLAELKEHTSEDEIIHYYRWLNEKVYA
jgi:tetratricopeptide (TPR) repeat protein